VTVRKTDLASRV